MPAAPQVLPALASPALRRRRCARGFSLIEVILAIGILAVALVTLLGLIGPTLGAVKTVTDTNVGIACISKMNAQLEIFPFYDKDTPNSSVYSWVLESQPATPTVFFFYDEVVSDLGSSPEVVVPRVALFYDNSDARDKGVTSVSGLNGATEGSLQSAVSGVRVRGPIIAVAMSLSPLAQNMPPPLGNGGSGSGGIYPSGEATSIFPGNTLEAVVGSDPNATKGGGATATIAYTEAYLPILIQVFSISSENIGLAGVGTGAGQFNPATDLTESNRLFTYTTAKVR